MVAHGKLIEKVVHKSTTHQTFFSKCVQSLSIHMPLFVINGLSITTHMCKQHNCLFLLKIWTTKRKTSIASKIAIFFFSTYLVPFLGDFGNSKRINPSTNQAFFEPYFLIQSHHFKSNPSVGNWNKVFIFACPNDFMLHSPSQCHPPSTTKSFKARKLMEEKESRESNWKETKETNEKELRCTHDVKTFGFCLPTPWNLLAKWEAGR
jgi:hypothetical protein